MRNEHDHIQEQLPWFINGTLDAQRHSDVQTHLADCPRCQQELIAQQRLRAALTQPAKVEIAPQASFNKLWERISCEDRGQRIQIKKNPGRELRRWWQQQWRQHWIPVTLSAQALAIVVLVGFLAIRGESPASYHTVTAPSHEDKPIIHVVFADDTRLSDVKEVLTQLGLDIVEGPSAAGVYALTPSARSSNNDLVTKVKTLREDPRVRFAELSHP